MNLSNFSNISSENNSKKGLYEAILPFDFEYDEESGKIEITSVGRSIYFTGITDPEKGYVNGIKFTAKGHALCQLGFIKNEKERTFDHLIFSYETVEDSKINSRITQAVIFIEQMRGKQLDKTGKDNFEFHSFKEFITKLTDPKIITPKVHKVDMVLEWREEESLYANYQLAYLKEGKQYYPNILPENSEEGRIDLMARSVMYLPVEKIKKEVSSISEDEVDSLLEGTDVDDWLNS